MTKDESSLIVAQMHAVAMAETPVPALTALVPAHPFPVTERVETVLPNIHEIITVDIALMIVRPYAGTSGDAAVHKHRSHGDACLT